MFDLLRTVATGQLPEDTSSVDQIALWDTALEMASTSGPEVSPSHAPRPVNLVLQQAARESQALAGPYAKLAAPLQQARSASEFERILAALALEPSTEDLLHEAATQPPDHPLVHASERHRINARLVETGVPLAAEVSRVARGEVLASVRQGKPIPHREVLMLSPAALVYRPDIPPLVAEELIAVHEGHICTQALIGTFYRDTPTWIRESLMERSLRGLKAILRLLASTGYQVRGHVLPPEERIGSLEEEFVSTRAYREAERQEALAVLAARRKQRAS